MSGMAMEYLGLSDINGPLVALDGVSGVGFEEMAVSYTHLTLPTTSRV